MIKAIYIQDVNSSEMPVFTYDSTIDKFTHGEMEFDYHMVMNSNDWLIFVTNNSVAYPIENKNVLPIEEIISLTNIDNF